MSRSSIPACRHLAHAAWSCLIVAVCFAPTHVLRAQHAYSDTAARDTARAHSLPPVRVVAVPARGADAASAVTILPEAIRTTPATNAWDIVRQTAGVEVHQQGQGPGFASDAVIRGFTSDHSSDVAITIDGVPLNQPVNGHAEGYADWNEILPEAVSSIRVLKGPVSPWIGNFGMGGEVEVETVPVAVGTRWSVRAGSYGDGRLALVTGRADTSGGLVFAGDVQRDDGWRRNSRSSVEHLLYNHVWLGGHGSTALGVRGYAAQWDSPGFLTLDQFAAGDLRRAADPTDGGSTGTAVLRGAIERTTGGGVRRSLLYGRVGEWHLFLNIPPEGGIGEGTPSQTEELDRRLEAGGTTRYEHELGPAHLMLGVEYRAVRASYQRYVSTARHRDSVFVFDDGTPARLQATYLAASPVVETHWDLSRALSLALGGRLDGIYYGRRIRGGDASAGRGRVVLSPKVSALYRLVSGVAAYTAFNGGFRTADGVIASPSLEPSRAWASEVGLRLTGRRVEGSLALFDLEVTNEQTFNPVTRETIADGRSRRRGVEVDGRLGVVPAVALFAHATVNDAHYLRLVSDDGDTLSGKPVFGVARATLEAGVDIQYRGGLGSIWAAYTGPFTPIGEPEARTAAYTLIHARGLILLTRVWSLAVGVQNLLDRKYPEVRASGFVNPGQPLTVLVTLRWGAGA